MNFSVTFAGMDSLPIFSNTCGKIFEDKVVFAFNNGERKVAVKKISAVKFIEKPTGKSLMLMALPLPVLIVVYLEKKMTVLLDLAGYAAAMGVFALAFLYAEKRYRITLEMDNGSKMSINVSKDNRKDAKKFVDKLKLNAGL